MARFKPQKVHKHPCEGCGVVVKCGGNLSHWTRCPTCFDKVADEILFGGKGT